MLKIPSISELSKEDGCIITFLNDIKTYSAMLLRVVKFMEKACVPLLLDKGYIEGAVNTDNKLNCITHTTVKVHMKFPSTAWGVW